MKAVEVKDLVFGYENAVDVLHGISFALEEGTYNCILGPNGSGKSTLAKLILGLLAAGSGSIKIYGEELTEESVYRIRDQVGIVFQDPDNQFIGSTVRDDIAFGLENHCVPREQMDPIIEEFAASVSMTDYLGSEPTKLSGGQKQRVAIAGVLAMSPKILIFDESTSMLDPDGRHEINKLIYDLHKERGMTIISITHDIDEAVNCDRILVIDDGKIVMDGTPEQILTNEKELVRHKLDVPFAVRMQKELLKHKIKTGQVLKTGELAEEICRLNFVK